MHTQNATFVLYIIRIYLTKCSKIMLWTMEQKIFCVKTYYETNSFKIGPTRYRRKFKFNIFPIRSQNFQIVRNFETHNTCKDRRATVSSLSGSLITARTPKNLTRVQEWVARVFLDFCEGGVSSYVFTLKIWSIVIRHDFFYVAI